MFSVVAVRCCDNNNFYSFEDCRLSLCYVYVKLKSLLPCIAIRQETKNKKQFLKGLYKIGEVPNAANSTSF